MIAAEIEEDARKRDQSQIDKIFRCHRIGTISTGSRSFVGLAANTSSVEHNRCRLRVPLSEKSRVFKCFKRSGVKESSVDLGWTVRHPPLPPRVSAAQEAAFCAVPV